MAEVAQSAQHEFWRPPVATPATERHAEMVEACDRCGSEFIVDSRFEHITADVAAFAVYDDELLRRPVRMGCDQFLYERGQEHDAGVRKIGRIERLANDSNHLCWVDTQLAPRKLFAHRERQVQQLLFDLVIQLPQGLSEQLEYGVQLSYSCGESVQCPKERNPIFFMRAIY